MHYSLARVCVCVSDNVYDVFFSVARHYIIRVSPQLTRVKWFEYQNAHHAHKRQILWHIIYSKGPRQTHRVPLARNVNMYRGAHGREYIRVILRLSMKTKTKRGRKRVVLLPNRRRERPSQNAFTHARFAEQQHQQQRLFDTRVCIAFSETVYYMYLSI